MGMREWCLHWWTISYENLKTLCGPELEAVEACVTDDEWYRLAAEDLVPDDKPFMAAAEALQRRFSEATGGLELAFLTYDAGMDGTRGREVEPYCDIIFGVSGVTTLTPAGQAHQHLLRESTWTDAG